MKAGELKLIEDVKEAVIYNIELFSKALSHDLDEMIIHIKEESYIDTKDATKSELKEFSDEYYQLQKNCIELFNIANYLNFEGIDEDK